MFKITVQTRRLAAMAAPGLCRQRLLTGRPNGHRRLDADDVRQIQRCHSGAKAAVHAIARISQHDTRRNACGMSRTDLIECDLWLRLELDLLRDMRLFSACLIICPPDYTVASA